jgi:hypothetical protein
VPGETTAPTATTHSSSITAVSSTTAPMPI